jgi:hypothetical protein
MIFALALRVVIQEEERRRQGNADHTGYGNLLGHGQRPPLLSLPLSISLDSDVSGYQFQPFANVRNLASLPANRAATSVFSNPTTKTSSPARTCHSQLWGLRLMTITSSNLERVSCVISGISNAARRVATWSLPGRNADNQLGELVGVPTAFGGHFGASGLLGQYFDLVRIQSLASASVSKSPI